LPMDGFVFPGIPCISGQRGKAARQKSCPILGQKVQRTTTEKRNSEDALAELFN